MRQNLLMNLIYKEERSYQLLDTLVHTLVGCQVRNISLIVLLLLEIDIHHDVDLVSMRLQSSYPYQAHVLILNRHDEEHCLHRTKLFSYSYWWGMVRKHNSSEPTLIFLVCSKVCWISNAVAS